MGLIDGIINNQIFGGSSQPITIDNSHVFSTTTDRDNYFIANPSKLVKDIYIQVGTEFQRYSGASWVGVIALIKGDRGLTGEQGIQGIQGERGADGEGIPSDGNARQILRKKLDGAEWYDKFPIKIVTDSYSVGLDDYIVLCNFATEKTITLPVDIENKAFIIKSIGTGGVKFTTQLDGMSDFTLYKGGSIQVVSNGADYFIISSAGFGI